MMFIGQITHMAHFHQVTSISITRIPLISAPMQTDKQKAVVSLKVLGAAEVCINSQQCLVLFFLIIGLSPQGLFKAFLNIATNGQINEQKQKIFRNSNGSVSDQLIIHRSSEAVVGCNENSCKCLGCLMSYHH